MKRKQRVRVHLKDQGLPSVEGLMVSRRGREYMIAVPRLIVAPDANPADLTSRYVAVPREGVAFYEVLE